MENYKNVLSCSVSYRRNIKGIPFVNKLTDFQQAISIAQSMSEILGEDFEFKALKNLTILDCELLKEQCIITADLIENKDISVFGKNYLNDVFVFVNEQDHIRIMARQKGYKLEKCYKDANNIDDKILDKLEISFLTDYGFLTANPNLCGTGLELEILMFLPAIIQNNKLAQIEKEIFKQGFILEQIIDDKNCPFIKIKNKYTFGYKENEFANNLDLFVKKINELENAEENTIFEFSASHLVDKIYRQFGILKNAYRLGYAESVNMLGSILWGIRLKMLKNKKQFDILDFLCTIKENHISQSGKNPKECEKLRAKKINEFLVNIEKGDVDV